MITFIQSVVKVFFFFFFLGGGGYIILKHLYLNDYAEFDFKIPYILFLHVYNLTCEIYTVIMHGLH